MIDPTEGMGEPSTLAEELYDGMVNEPYPEDFKLSQHESDSAIWKKVRGFLQDSLEKYRIINDEPRSELETAAIRGKIECIKEILAIGRRPEYHESEVPDSGY